MCELGFLWRFKRGGDRWRALAMCTVSVYLLVRLAEEASVPSLVKLRLGLFAGTPPAGGLTLDRAVADLALPAALGVAVILLGLVALNSLGACLAGRMPQLDTLARSITPAALRRYVLGLCGIALATSAASGAAAADPSSPPHPSLSPSRISGLPLPDLPIAPVRTVVVVHPGDSLWSIARRTLPSSASDAVVSRRVARLYADNRRILGPDPDLIFPGQTLLLPRGVS